MKVMRGMKKIEKGVKWNIRDLITNITKKVSVSFVTRSLFKVLLSFMLDGELGMSDEGLRISNADLGMSNADLRMSENRMGMSAGGFGNEAVAKSSSSDLEKEVVERKNEESVANNEDEVVLSAQENDGVISGGVNDVFLEESDDVNKEKGRETSPEEVVYFYLQKLRSAEFSNRRTGLMEHHPSFSPSSTRSSLHRTQLDRSHKSGFGCEDLIDQKTINDGLRGRKDIQIISESGRRNCLNASPKSVVRSPKQLFLDAKRNDKHTNMESEHNQEASQFNLTNASSSGGTQPNINSNSSSMRAKKNQPSSSPSKRENSKKDESRISTKEDEEPLIVKGKKATLFSRLLKRQKQ